MKRLSHRMVASLVVVALLVAGAGIYLGIHLAQGSQKQARVLVLLTVALPVPSKAGLTAEVTGLRLLPESGRGWDAVTATPQRVSLPGAWTAPNTDNLFIATVPDQTYREADLQLRSSAGGTSNDIQSVRLQPNPDHLTPLLFTVRLTGAGADSMTKPLSYQSAYAGNDEVNFGLQLAQRKVMSVPPVALESQSQRPVSLKQYRGKVVILASFISECQETCPLVDAALLQVEKTLRARDLLGKVQIVEVTQDPADDTPAILSEYRSYFDLPWPLLTGTSANVNSFWSGLGVPPIELQPWGGPAPIDRFTGKREPENILHDSVVDVINPQGYVVAEVQAQPTLSASSIPHQLYSYLDAQGIEEQRTGGAWTPQTILQVVDGLLQQALVPKSFPAAASAPVPGDQAPNFSLESTAGGAVSLHGLLGHPVMLDFWATWCTNCRADMKLVAATAARYQAQGLRVELINYRQSAGAARKFLKGLGVNLPSLLDPDARVAQLYGVPGLPVAVFISAQGKVSSIQLGQLQQAQVNQDIPKILS